MALCLGAVAYRVATDKKPPPPKPPTPEQVAEARRLLLNGRKQLNASRDLAMNCSWQAAEALAEPDRACRRMQLQAEIDHLRLVLAKAIAYSRGIEQSLINDPTPVPPKVEWYEQRKPVFDYRAPAENPDLKAKYEELMIAAVTHL